MVSGAESAANCGNTYHMRANLAAGNVVVDNHLCKARGLQCGMIVTVVQLMRDERWCLIVVAIPDRRRSWHPNETRDRIHVTDCRVT